RPSEEESERFLRTSLAAAVAIDPRPHLPPPLEVPPWGRGRQGHAHGAGRGVLRDPLTLRDELLRRQIGRTMTTLENVVRSLSPNAMQGVLRDVGGRRQFHPDVLQTLVQRRQLPESYARTLGDRPMTLAMLTGADPSFSFDTVGRRVARQRLAKIMLAVARLGDPADINAARVSAEAPPERWMSLLLRIGVLQEADLVDPWGHPFSFRRQSSLPRIVVSERAPMFAVASAGPDGRFGTGDDIEDPFARAIPSGTPYAVLSGEDALMRRLSLIAPGQTVLSRMTQAFDLLSWQVQDERTGGGATASASFGSEQMNLDGFAQGVGGMGGPGDAPAATPAPVTASRGRRAEMERSMDEAGDMEEMDDMGAPEPEEAAPRAQTIPAAPPVNQAMGEIIREEFPATLFFLGEARLEAGGATQIEVPLADALTTYKVEAIAWTESGWSTTAATQIRVDQDATVDAPVPPFAVVGDVLRIPARVQNRTGEPLRVRVALAAEDVSIEAENPSLLTIPARESIETVIEVRVSEAGAGALVVRASDEGGRALDAVRRPLTVYRDARLVRARREELIEGDRTIEIAIPEGAFPRGASELRLALGPYMFGDPQEWGGGMWAGWARTVAGYPVEDAGEGARRLLTRGSLDDPIRSEPLATAMAISVAWEDPSVSDPFIRRALTGVTRALEPNYLDEPVEWAPTAGAAQYLFALAGALRADGRGSETRADLRAVVDQLRRRLADESVTLSDAPVRWAAAAAALAITRDGRNDPRARELLRRAEREVIRVGDRAWLESMQGAGQLEGRIRPTALLAVAHIQLGERSAALPYLRSLASDARTADRWELLDRAYAFAAVAMVSPQEGRIAVSLDGQTLRFEDDGETRVAMLPDLASPGTHRLEISGDAAFSFVAFTVRYGMPWDVPPARTTPIALRIRGEAGARDTRAALTLELRNESPRVLAAPTVELDLPAGAEIDEPTRERLDRMTRQRATQEGRTLRLELRPLQPGAQIRLPIPVRWSVAGRLRGLGVAAYDAAVEADGEPPTAILTPRAIELEDEGPEPEPTEDDDERPEDPEPEPIPLLEGMGPVARFGESQVRA
ncbi:MAG: alpha-2-macroglobulin family protein, partial [Myxococcota bacterium]